MAAPIQFSSVACPGTIKNRSTFATGKPTIQLRSNSILQAQSQKHVPKLWRLDGLRMGSKRREHWRVHCQGGSGSIPSSNSSSVTESIKNFYWAINNKKQLELAARISDDCRFEELGFSLPFDTKEKILKYLLELMDAMGDNIELVTDNITEVSNNTAFTTGHLSWKGRKIPFTAGFIFIECKKDGERLLIKKVRGIEEFPLTPGDLILKLLKMTSTIFNKFPDKAEGMLSKSQESPEGLLSMVLDLLQN